MMWAISPFGRRDEIEFCPAHREVEQGDAERRDDHSGDAEQQDRSRPSLSNGPVRRA